METAVFFGVFLAIAGTAFAALGNNLIVKSSQKFNDNWQASLYFGLGNFLVVVIGTVLGLAAFAYAPQALISPLGGLTLVWNLLLAMLPFFGGVQPKGLEILATLLTLLGTVVIVALGPANREQKNTFWLLLKPSFVLLVTLYFSIGALLETVKHQSRRLRRIAAGALGGLVGGLSNVFAKAAIDFHAGNHVDVEKNDQFNFLIVASIAFALAASQLMFLNQALAAYSAMHIVPVYQTTLIIAATVSGGVAFEEFADFSTLRYIGFGSGVCLSIFGVILLVSASSSGVSGEEFKD